MRWSPLDDTENVNHDLAPLSIGGYLALTIIPVILLAVWGIAMYRADKYPEWRHGPQEQTAQPPIAGPGGVGLGRAGPGTLQVPAEPVSRTEDQPDTPERP